MAKTKAPVKKKTRSRKTGVAKAPLRNDETVSAAALALRRGFLVQHYNLKVLQAMVQEINSWLDKAGVDDDDELRVQVAKQTRAATASAIADHDSKIMVEYSRMALAKMEAKADIMRVARIRGVAVDPDDDIDDVKERLLWAKVITEKTPEAELAGDGMEDEEEEDENDDDDDDLREEVKQLRKQIVGLLAAKAPARGDGGAEMLAALKKLLDEKEAERKKPTWFGGYKEGTLGMKKRWQGMGDKRFMSWVKTRMSYRNEKVADDYGEEKHRWNFTEAQKRVKLEESNLREAIYEVEDAEDDTRKTMAEVRKNAAMKIWIESLEDVWALKKVLDEKDPRKAGHLADIYQERKYGVPEDALFKKVDEEADARTEKDRKVDWDRHMRRAAEQGYVHQGDGGSSERQSVFKRMRTEDPDEQEVTMGQQQPAYAKLAQDVFQDCPEDMHGKYVTVSSANKFADPRLEQAAGDDYVQGSRLQGKKRKLKCMCCGERGHEGWECGVEEYERGGKTFIPLLWLHREGWIDARGKVLSIHKKH